ncbi:hypothetical protein K9N50_03800 [bacterium]|nr:hypothetical protein [bacterium]
MNTEKLHETDYRNGIIYLIAIILLGFVLVRSSNCQTDNDNKKGPLDSLIACCHYLEEEVSYIRISFTFADSARKFNIKASDDFVEAPRMESYKTYKFEFDGMEDQPLFENPEVLNFTNCFYIIDLVTKGNNNYLLLSDNFQVTDHRVKQFVKEKIFVDLFIEIDPFHIVDVMQAVEFQTSKRDTVYLDTLVIKKIVHDTVYVQVGGDTLTARKYFADTLFVEKHDTIYVESVVHDTVFIDVHKDDRIFVTKDVLGDVPIIKNIVFANNGDYGSDLNYIFYSKYSHWFEDPYFTLDFKFKTHSKELNVIKPDKILNNVPEGWAVQYVIAADEEKLIPFGDYVRLHHKIAIRLENNRCYLLAREGIVLKPEKIKDKDEKTLTLRVNY